MPQRTRRRIVVFTLLIAKLFAMDFAMLPMASAAPRVETGAAATSAHHCAEMASEADAQVHAAVSHIPSAGATHPSGETHHGCRSVECKCFCAHAPAVVAAVTLASPSAPSTDVPSLAAASPGSRGVSVLFRPPI